MVLVSHTHQLIFLKTRKTAGTSVEMLLEAATGLGPNPPVESRASAVNDKGAVGFRMLPIERMTDQDRLWGPHTPARKLRRILGQDIWDRYLKVACVRNPFDRMISLFHWSQTYKPAAERDESHDGFAAFMRGNWQDDSKVVMIGDTFVPDILLHYETLKDDLNALAHRTGLDFDPDTLPHTKALAHKRLGSLAEYFTDELVDIVRTRLNWMFRFGGYAQELPQPQIQGAT
jgi:hypothetical protein